MKECKLEVTKVISLIKMVEKKTNKTKQKKKENKSDKFSSLKNSHYKRAMANLTFTTLWAN